MSRGAFPDASSDGQDALEVFQLSPRGAGSVPSNRNRQSTLGPGRISIVVSSHRGRPFLTPEAALAGRAWDRPSSAGSGSRAKAPVCALRWRSPGERRVLGSGHGDSVARRRRSMR